MAIGSGVGSQVGFSRESVYGTYVAPTKFVRGSAYTAVRAAERVQGEGITAGGVGPLGAHFVETTQAATGSLTHTVTSKGNGLLLESLCGGASTSAVETGAAYKQTHQLANENRKSLSFQIGAPFRSGTVHCQTLTGVKVISAEFTCDVNGLLQATWTLDAQKYDESQTLATAAYLADKPFHGRQSAVKLGSFGAEEAQTGVTAAALTWALPMDVDNYTFGGGGLKSEPVVNALADISGSVTADWTTAVKTGLHDRLIANTPTSLVWEFLGDIITGAIRERIVFTIPGVHFSGDTQSVNGVETLSNQYSWNWKFDGTNLPSIVVGTTETAL